MRYKHQKEFIEAKHKKHLLAWGTGVGKTYAAIQGVKMLGYSESLIICPKLLTENWKREIARFGGGEIDWRIVSKEQFKKTYQTLPPYRSVIIDEAHTVAGIKSKLSKTVLAYIKKYNPENIYLLTATPYLSTPWNIYVLAKILGYNWNYRKFEDYFFYRVKMGARTVPVKRKNMEAEISGLVSRIGSTVKLNDCADVPADVFKIEYFTLTSQQEEAIASLEDILPIVRWTKIHQICGGSLKGDEYTPTQTFNSNKFDRCLEIASQEPKIAIVCRYNAELEYISSKLNKRKTIIINGATKNKQEQIDKVNNADNCVVLINSACSCGYNMWGIPVMVFYSYDFSLVNFLQMKGRIQRIDKLQKCVYISLLVKDTIDEDVYRNIMAKKRFDIEIYATRKGG